MDDDLNIDTISTFENPMQYIDRRKVSANYLQRSRDLSPTVFSVLRRRHNDVDAYAHAPGSFDFDFGEQQFEVFRHFESSLPSQIMIDADILGSGTQYGKCDDSTVVVGDSVRVSSTSNVKSIPTRLEGVLPVCYLTPWPTLTPTLPFSNTEGYVVNEATVITLLDYQDNLQTDESLELGLRLVSHERQDQPTICILPCVLMWNYV